MPRLRVAPFSARCFENHPRACSARSTFSVKNSALPEDRGNDSPARVSVTTAPAQRDGPPLFCLPTPLIAWLIGVVRQIIQMTSLPASKKVTNPRLDLAFYILSVVCSLFFIFLVFRVYPEKKAYLAIPIFLTFSNCWTLRSFVQNHKEEIVRNEWRDR